MSSDVTNLKVVIGQVILPGMSECNSIISYSVQSLRYFDGERKVDLITSKQLLNLAEKPEKDFVLK